MLTEPKPCWSKKMSALSHRKVEPRASRRSRTVVISVHLKALEGFRQIGNFRDCAEFLNICIPRPLQNSTTEVMLPEGVTGGTLNVSADQPNLTALALANAAAVVFIYEFMVNIINLLKKLRWWIQ